MFAAAGKIVAASYKEPMGPTSCKEGENHAFRTFERQRIARLRLLELSVRGMGALLPDR